MTTRDGFSTTRTTHFFFPIRTENERLRSASIESNERLMMVTEILLETFVVAVQACVIYIVAIGSKFGA